MVRYHGLDGTPHEVPDETKRVVLRAMGVAADDDAAISLSLEHAPHRGETRMEAPQGTHCHLPHWLQHSRAWGISVQVYSLRSRRNWGMGDFADLAAFATIAAEAGADFVGTNPLHAPFLATPERRSPFSPSNRRFFNPLYIAPDAVPGFSRDLADEARLAELRQTELVDYQAVTETKLAALRRIWPVWQDLADMPEPYGQAAFAQFCADGGEPLRLHALFEAISADQVKSGGAPGWRDWPEDLHDPKGQGARIFAAENEDEIAFQCWLQWLASVQLEEASDAAKAAGLRIGLYLDIAVGEAPDGSASWSDPGLAMRGLEIGAPPDYFAVDGQNWGLAALSPSALVERSMQPFTDMLDAAMVSGGAVRIDHAMAIWQLFLLPEGELPSSGTYVRYPIGGMAEALAARSNQHQSIVVGEDLGNVPEGFRELMGAIGMLSYRILYFERHHHGFLPPDAYPELALACLSTHDLPTIQGWWDGNDVELRLSHDLIDQQGAAHQAGERGNERRQLLGALEHAGLLERVGEESEIALTARMVAAIHRYVARTPSKLFVARVEDMTAETEPTNLPGTIDSYPNWKRKLTYAIEDISKHEVFRAVAQGLAEERPKQH
ncbi:4-alpha-glucanotransferase [Devosia pacifica]|uniref:4-alpha-glucanotransferase n=2 Tax=Devosia pacifica TaxID=1335967 RepID=A0A918S5G1_9HYPH|nr:4-alpha-glucanotransferase [Devosia pacifica]